MKPDADALLSLIRQMQACMVRYLTPEDYWDHEGGRWDHADAVGGFAHDIISILDCPEMIEAMGELP